MTSENQSSLERTNGVELTAMIGRAKLGSDRSQIGRLLDLYRNYLNLIAQGQINARLKTRVEASDVVQETFLDAHRDFANFRGQTEAELVAWLRKILARNIMDQARMHGAQRRDVQREQSLNAAVDDSNKCLENALDGDISTPSRQVARREQAVLVADAIANLPEHYRQVISMRQIQKIPFSEIANKLGKSTDSVRMIWQRALQKLKQSLE